MELNATADRARHPHGVEPWGNFFYGPGAKEKLDIRSPSLGTLSLLSDELILEILGRLDACSLAHAQLISRAMYCFCSHEDLWRAHVLQEYEGRFEWAGSWQRTYAATHVQACASAIPRQAHSKRLADSDADFNLLPASKRRRSVNVSKATQSSSIDETAVAIVPHTRPPLRVRGLYSDLLYQPWLCANLDIDRDWLAIDNIDRRSSLSVQQFREEYEKPNRPVVITDVVCDWPASKKWTREFLAEALEGSKVLAGGYEMDFRSYLRYCDGQNDEMPLYLFDKGFVNKAPRLAADFTVPEYFKEDLFSVLGSVWRPDYRWLIMGPARSGSSFHVDPNATSAWNAVVTGSKKWLLYPPGSIPPGVHPSADGADVAAPVSIAEWYLNFYSSTREGKVAPVECLVKAGELLFIPKGWWHCAWNLEESIAVTQNYVGASHLPAVLAFLKPGRQDLVSGCAPEDRGLLYERFVAALRRERPEVLQLMEKEEAARLARTQESRKLSALFRGPVPPDRPVATIKDTGAPSSEGEVVRVCDKAGVLAGPSEPTAAPFSFGFKFPQVTAADVGLQHSNDGMEVDAADNDDVIELDCTRQLAGNG